MRSLHLRENIALALSGIALFAAVGGPSWAASKISGQRLSNNSVTSSKIRNSTIRGVDVRNGTLSRADVRSDFFTGLQSALTPGSLTSLFLANDAVTTEKIANQSVTGVKLDPGAVSTTRLLNNAVTSAKIDNGTITADDLADNSVAAGEIADDAVTTGDIARNGVTGQNLDASGATVLDFASIPDGTCAAAPIAVSGADLGDDVVAVTPPATFPTTAIAAATVQSATQLSVTVCNFSGGAIEPDGTYRWIAVQG
jgi:hypothetical protein